MPFSLLYSITLVSIIIIMIIGMRGTHNMLRSLNHRLTDINDMFECQFTQYKIFQRDMRKSMNIPYGDNNG